MWQLLGALISGFGGCPPDALCNAGTRSASATLTLSVSLESSKEIAFNVIPQGQGLSEVVASLIVTGSPEARFETLDYGVIGDGLIRIAEVDGHLAIEVPDTMIAFDLRAGSNAAVVLK